ncbi:MAG TPA: ankyrin repeat domain-containing protein, partial [Puia sp.]|nr:ankyrin repeat domain-containing protein [Puia sp.]
MGLHVHGQGSSTGAAALFSVIRSGDGDKLEQLLNAGANPNDTMDGYSPLMAAALNGTAEAMKILIRYGADINYINPDSLTALWLAIPDEEKTMLLLDKGADAHIIARGGMTMLNKLVSIPGTAPLIQLFITKGTDVKKNNDGNSLIVRTVISGDTAVLGMLIRLGLDINEADPAGVPPIIYAAQYHSLSTLAMLVEQGA